MPAVKFIIFIFFILVTASFAAKNMQAVDINYIDFDLQTQSLKLPATLLVLAPLGVGFVLAWIAGSFVRMKLRSSIRKQKKTIEQLSGDLEKLNAELYPEEEIPKIVSEK